MQTTLTAHKRVDELQPGDKVVTAEGEVVRVTKITRGFWDKSRLSSGHEAAERMLALSSTGAIVGLAYAMMTWWRLRNDNTNA